MTTIEHDFEVLPPDKPGGKKRLVIIRRETEDEAPREKPCILCAAHGVLPWEHSRICVLCRQAVRVPYILLMSFADNLGLADAHVTLKHLEIEIGRHRV